ncbi:hypothetical protein CVD25_20610 [Bacillus canaveralius]|uniref:Uncharacterized protein n=1 Tax=Bacillus canaveralius TaxID=1403243 RepID=A0A2N5GK26_9BACI|nr:MULTISPECIES: hypothetical protein [Bacillus]PLR78371.1 hypothetical protein CU633_06070 [Bacillus sp. V3-13]PLR81666.1 hypothetical protein CU635_14520 [Bacillus canaveralius]PLR87732.1 hypothetical protein CVD23_00670 [Bacillus sp. V33-4]PLR89870.1 hypothetical protein CVD25_20610 [Bacillus canaveralius]
MENEPKDQLRNQVERVIDLVIAKKKQREHPFLDTLLKRLQDLLETIDANNYGDLSKDPKIKGALRAYFDTNLIESYEEPLVVELDKLEMMLK